jgi:hypothetical protein
MHRIERAAFLLIATTAAAQTPAPAVEVAPASRNLRMPAPDSAPANVGDEVPLPDAAGTRAGADADELVAARSGDPYFLGFAGGRYYPGADERLDPELVAAAAQARLDGRSETYGFVMFAKRMTPERGATLAQLGVRVLQFHPHYCLKVALPVDALDAVAALDFVRWVGVARSTQKLHPALAQLEPQRDGRLALYVSVFESDLGPQSTWTPAASLWRTDGGVASELSDSTDLPRRWTSRGPAQRALEALGVEVREYVDEIRAFRVFALPQHVEALAALDVVQFLEPDLPARTMHDESTPMIGTDVTRLYFPGNASGVNSIAQADSGVDAGHSALWIAGIGWDFTGLGNPWTDGCEHGTHVMGTILGDGANSYWSSLKGVAPGLARGGSATRAHVARIFDNGCAHSGTAASTVFSVNRSGVWDGSGWTTKPHLSSNSWGTSGIGWIGSEANARAVDSEVWNYRQLYLFAAGNSGSGAQTVGQEGVAKNALTVGNVIDYYGSEGFPGTVAFDSSRGPCGDGRWKPNVCAPGDSITSVDANSWSGYKALRGTSMATPHVAGLAAQMTDVFTWMRYEPSALMATLMSSAETKGGVALTTPSDSHLNAYGAGKVSGHKAILGSSDYWFNNWNFDATWVGGWTFGDFAVPANCKRITVCMTYIEPEASAGANPALINDWDLWLDDPWNGIDPAGNGGDWFAQQSNRSNVEIRTLDNPTIGTWRWKVWPAAATWFSTVRMSVTVTYELNQASAAPAIDVYASATYAQPNQPVYVYGVATNANGLASGASFDAYPGGGNFTAVQGPLADVIYADHLDNPGAGRQIELGDIAPGSSRWVYWLTSWPTEGIKNFASYLDVDNWGWTYDSTNVIVDGTWPPHPSISSTSHAPLVWSNDNTIDFTWTQPPDNLSGIQGYATVIGSLGIPLDPGFTINLGPVTSTTIAVPNSTMAIYLSMRPFDNAGNASPTGYAWSPPYLIDSAIPGTPGPLSSSTHTPGVASCSTTVSLSWTVPVDLHSGVAGFLGTWDTSPTTVPGGPANLGVVTGVTQEIGSSPLARYFHLRAIDAAGNFSHTAHFGPVLANANSVATYCTAKTNSLGCLPAIGTNGVQPKKSTGNFTVTCSNVLNQKNGLLFWGLGSSATPFQGGFKCVANPTLRTTSISSGGAASGNSCTGTYAFNFSTAYMNSVGLAPGHTVFAQWWMRDPASPSTTGLSNAVQFTVCE